MRTVFMAQVSINSPPSAPAIGPCPVARTATGRSRSAAYRTAAITSASPVAVTASSGVGIAVRSKPARAASYSGVPGRWGVIFVVKTGSPRCALPELDVLIREWPFREHLHALRMTALYRCGRSEEALAAYEEVRRTLRDELGLTPGPELQKVQQQILEHDVAIDPPAPRTAAPDVHLPATMTALLGRDADLVRVEELLSAHRLVTLTGPAGTGKTRLAVEVARRSAARHPDGVHFVDLAPLSSGEPIAEVVLSAIGRTTATAGSAEEALRTAVRGRRMLLVVDNCEHVLAEAARVLTTVLGGGTAVTALATSREQLDLDGELIYPVAPLDPDDSAVELFLERLRAAAPHLEDTPDLRERAAEICAALDGLPLAIELAAARARVYSLAEIKEQIDSDPTRLARIGRPGAERRQSLMSALKWGHRLLTPAEQFVHRRLAALPGSFGLDAAAATVGRPAAEVADLLPMLVNRSLPTSGPAPRAGGPTVFRQLVVVRAHVTRALADAGETEPTPARRDAWVSALATVESRTDRLDLRRRYRVVDDDYAAVRACSNATSSSTPPGPRHGWRAGCTATGTTADSWSRRCAGSSSPSRRWTRERRPSTRRGSTSGWPRCSPTRAGSNRPAGTARSGSPSPTGSHPSTGAPSASTSPSRRATCGRQATPRRVACSSPAPSNSPERAGTPCSRCSRTPPAASSRAISWRPR